MGCFAVLVEEPEQEVLSADEAVAEQAGLLLGQHEDLPGGISEAFKHSSSLAAGTAGYQKGASGECGDCLQPNRWADAC